MATTTRARISSAIVVIVGVLWAAITIIGDVASFPEDVRKIWSGLVHAPQYLPWGLFGIGICVLAWSLFWPPNSELPQFAMGVSSQGSGEEQGLLSRANPVTRHPGRAESAALKRWTEATLYLAAHRDVLATLGKRYHRAIDETPDKPLIGRRDWLLDEPVQITRSAPASRFDHAIPDVEGRRLQGLPVDYTELKMQLSSGTNFNNGDSFRMLDVAPNAQSLEFTFGCGKYFNYLNTCEALGAELADFAVRFPSDVERLRSDLSTPFPSSLPHRGLPADIMDFSNRSAFVGVNCLLMMRNYSDHHVGDEGRRDVFALHDRGKTTLEAQNCTHVVPAGGHQPMTEEFGDEREFGLWSTVVREFCEELFNKEEASRMRGLGESFLDHRNVRPLIRAFFDSGAARSFLLGVGLDPVSTKPEILVALVVDWRLAANLSNRLKIEENYEGRVRLIDLSKASLERQVNRTRTEKPLLPAGRACMVEAIKHYDFLMSD
jgi:hypothetical protein